MVLSSPLNTSVRQGSDFNISFNYLAIPQPNFTWYINDVLRQSVDGTTTSGTHTMIFTSVSEEGWYSCVVENELGRDEYRVFVDTLGMYMSHTHTAQTHMHTHTHTQTHTHTYIHTHTLYSK